ncbi:MAG TPA: hypothetical protein VH414_08870 [Lichenihabitans sp.]|jgi:FtsZ-binding cell division protein ZapB|nr:hypothetical protein [Lichenihabitans sp.]
MGATSISDRQQPERRNGRLAEDIRRLSLDLEDLRFENDRLKSELRQAQTEILALTERNTVLQQRFERLVRLAPRGSTRLVRWLTRLFRRP